MPFVLSNEAQTFNMCRLRGYYTEPTCAKCGKDRGIMQIVNGVKQYVSREDCEDPLVVFCDPK